MFYQKSWTEDADNPTSIGLGWTVHGKSGEYIRTISGAAGPTSDDSIVGFRTTAAAQGGELYAEVTISAVDADSEIYVGFATAFSSNDLDSAALYARYSASNTRFQILRKVAASVSLASASSSVTRALVPGDILRLSLHNMTATLSVNGEAIASGSVAANPDVSSYLFPAIRFRSSPTSRITAFKAADYGVEEAPSGSDPVSALTGGDYFLKTSGALSPLVYLGMKIGENIIQQGVELYSAPPLVYPEQEGYGPDPTMANAPVLPGSFTPQRVVNVSNVSQLQAAILDAEEGDLIEMAPGLYNEKIVLNNLNGTASNPIVLRGPKEAIIQLGDGPDGGGEIDYGSGYAFALDNCSYVWCVGFTVQYGPKGIMCDETNDCWFKGLTVQWVEQEAFHLRNFSSRNLVEDCIVHTTGRRSPGFGEAYYVGTAVSNWNSGTSRTNGNPDTCDDNIIRRCQAYNFTGEAVDIKEGTSRTIVEYCWFDGSWLNDDNSADTWVDVKGNDAIIQYNYGQKTFNGAYSVYDPINGSSGRNNVFRGNVGDTRRIDGSNSPDVAINIKVSGAGNIVYSDNQFTGSAGALTNITQTPA